MKKIEVKLVFTKEFCEKVGELDFYNKLAEKKVSPTEVDVFIIKNQCDSISNLIDSKIKSETKFTEYKTDFVKVKTINVSENSVEIQVDIKVRDRSKVKSKLLHPFDFIVKKNKKLK